MAAATFPSAAYRPEPDKRHNGVACEVRPKIRFSPINVSDLPYVRGHYSGVTPHFPAGAGFEGVAVIDAVGPDAAQELTDLFTHAAAPWWLGQRRR